MTFPINVNIPAANNDPADDQQPMQVNFSNINSYLQVDHTNPAAIGAGAHKQVTFFSNNEPSAPTSPPVLFSNILDGAGNALPGAVPGLFFYSGATVAGKNQNVCLANGSVVLLGGIIMKWGTATLLGTGFNQPVGFPVAFPNACFSVIAISSAVSNSVTVASATSFTTGGFVAIKTSSSTVLPINYIAIGN